ncbi:MAG: sigma-70 family RNA polymerase sigma factor [Actinomycetota bacterium]|nr:sigma-70 family RNA polymerase sigma factor [Actinomycetota bacterium]
MPELAPLVRRVVGSRISDPATVEDVTQDTLERLVAIEGRLDPSALPPYAVVTARNAVRGWGRGRERELRHRPRMFDPRQSQDPEEQALQDEERGAVAAALERLPASERDPLIAHDVEGIDTREIADRLGTTPGALAVRLSRTRARLRVEYLLALRRVELPTAGCKRVLLALSAGDKRQQRASGAGEHLLVCPPCAELSRPLVHRRRPLAVLWPFLGLDHLARWLRRTARQHPVPSVAAGVTVAAVAVWAAVALSGGERPQPVLFVQASSPVPLSGTEPLAPYAGMAVEGRGVAVQSMVEPKGFWVGNSRTERVWVDVHDQSEPPGLVVGQRITFQGTLVANTADTLDRAGAGGASDREQLERQGYHVDVTADAIHPVSSPAPPGP